MNDIEILKTMLERAGLKSSIVVYDQGGEEYLALFVEHEGDEVSEFDFTVGGTLVNINPRSLAARAWPAQKKPRKRTS